MKSCFLFGHADTPSCIMPELERIIDELYLKYNVREFFVGNRGRFDSMSAVAVARAKEVYTDIRLFLVLVYYPVGRPIDLPDSFDAFFYPPLETTPKRYAIVRANRYMIDHSDSLVCFAQHAGNAKKLYEYAASKGDKLVFNLSDNC